jgi:hypothetical protein
MRSLIRWLDGDRWFTLICVGIFIGDATHHLLAVRLVVLMAILSGVRLVERRRDRKRLVATAGGAPRG